MVFYPSSIGQIARGVFLNKKKSSTHNSRAVEKKQKQRPPIRIRRARYCDNENSETCLDFNFRTLTDCCSVLSIETRENTNYITFMYHTNFANILIHFLVSNIISVPILIAVVTNKNIFSHKYVRIKICMAFFHLPIGIRF